MERIEWIDSGLSFASTWLDESTIIERAKEWHGVVVSVGQVIFEDDESVILGLSHDSETGHWSSCFGIKKTCITKRVVLSQLAERAA